ncbi:MAG: CBS domain-containing protein [Kofleriaceae bacterium]
MPEPNLLRANDLMERNVLAVDPQMPILSVYRMFVEQQIHGAPVIDDQGRVMGVISTVDLLRVIRKEVAVGRRTRASKSYWCESPSAHLDHVVVPEHDHLWELVARDAMSTEVIAVDPELPIADVAQTMLENRIHRVLVMSGRRLDGVLTTFDLMRALVRPPEVTSSAVWPG